MKKLSVLIMFFVLIFAFSGRDLKAESEDTQLFVKVGTVTDDSFSFSPFLWSAGVNMDFHISDNLMICPECDIISHGFKFDYFFLCPGALLNVKSQSFFIGAGVTKWFLIGEGSDFSTDFMLKINAGYIKENIRITAYIVTSFDELFKYNVIGFSIGLGF